jgi:ABC-type lipoprotein export system ATPase subunit
VAFARALASKPALLLADEPTGNLDEENSAQIASLLREQQEQGLTVILVTHDVQFARRNADRIIRLRYGRIDDAETGGER